MASENKIPILIPAHNEGDGGRFERNLERMKNILGDSAVLIVISNASDDNTAEIARNNADHVIELKEQGKLGALQQGWHFLEGVLGRKKLLATPVIHLDADSEPVEDPQKWLEAMIKPLENIEHPRIVAGRVSFTNSKTGRHLFIRNLVTKIGRAVWKTAGITPYDSGNQAILMNNEEALERFYNMEPKLWVGEDAAMAGMIANNYTGGDRVAIDDQYSTVTNPYDHKTWWNNYPKAKAMYYRELKHPGKFQTGEDYLRAEIAKDPNLYPFGLPDDFLEIHKEQRSRLTKRF